MCPDLTFDLSFKVKREPNLKMLITHFLLVLEVWDGKPTYRRSWAGNLLVWSDLTLDPTGVSLSVMKSAYISLIINPRGLVCQANL